MCVSQPTGMTRVAFQRSSAGRDSNPGNAAPRIRHGDSGTDVDTKIIEGQDSENAQRAENWQTHVRSKAWVMCAAGVVCYVSKCRTLRSFDG